MCRRTAAWVIAVVLAAGLTACSGDTQRAAGNAPAGPPAATLSAAPEPTLELPADGRAPTGTFAVGRRQLSVNRGGQRPMTVTVWHPAVGRPGGQPAADRPVAEGRFPVVVFSHGLGGRPADYASLLTGWAAAGFVVAAPAYPFTSGGTARQNVLDVLNQPADASYVLTEVLALDALQGRLDPERVAAAGHSAGGITTIGLFTGERDERFDAGIVLAGSALGVGTAFAGPAAPLLFVHGERDNVVSYGDGRALFDAVPWPKAMLSIPAGAHSLRSGDDDFEVVAESTAEFLRWSLYGDRQARQRFAEAAARDGLTTLDDRL